MCIPLPGFTGERVLTLTLALCLLCGWTLGSPRAQAQSVTERLAGSPKVPWQISADTVDYDAAATTYHARGNVIIEKQAARLMADAVAFNHQAMTAMASGHVVMTVGEDVLTGERLELDLNQDTGVLYDGTVFMQQNHFYIRGERIEKTGKDSYRAQRGSITSCDGDRPDWIIGARSIKVDVEGYGTATHAVLKARQLPLLYSPFIAFPAKSRRQSGLLIPEPGFSDRKGFAWDQPLFWAIDDSSDATLYTHYMEKRGTKIGLEYRYALTESDYGTVMADGFEDRHVDDGTPEATEAWGYAGDAYDRPNTDRYWLRAKLDQDLPSAAKMRLDLDIVSDQDYLVEFQDGLSGFDASRDYFLETFGRDLDTYDETIRTNRLNINKTWARYAFNGDLLWYDNVTRRRWEDTDTTLQQLPVITFNGAKQKAFDSGVYWDLESEYDYFYREDGERGHRADLYPRAYLPLRWKNYLSVEPSAGWRQTVWVMDRWDNDDLDQTSHRQLYDLQLDLSTQFSKVMNSPVPGVDKIRHSVKPQVIYEYLPHQDQSDLPLFVRSQDRIEELNQFTYSLTNTFTSRSTKKVAPRSSANSGDGAAPGQGPADRLEEGIPEPPLYDYLEFCRFYLEQTYSLIETDADASHPFSDIYGELEFNPSRYLGLETDATYDIYESRFSSHNIGAGLSDYRGDQLWVEHRYQTNVAESIHTTLSINLTDALAVRGEHERNMLDSENLITGAGFLYAAQCWALDFFYAREGKDDKITFLIDLRGIGGFGK